MPPFFGFTRMLRVCDSTPPSHSAVHFDQPDHADMTQSTGHLYCPHRLYFSVAGHLMPHSSFGTTIARVIFCQPPHSNGLEGSHLLSQLTEHSAATHPSTSQSWISSVWHSVAVASTAFRTTLIA